MEQKGKELKVSAIENGTVLDHIPATQLFKVIDILDLSHCQHPITFGTNLDSKLLGKKAIIKISGKYFKDEELNRIALVAPLANANIIKDYEVVEKKRTTVPDRIEGIARCSNPKCVTNHQPIKSIFTTIRQNNGSIKLHCHYCEKDTPIENVEVISVL